MEIKNMNLKRNSLVVFLLVMMIYTSSLVHTNNPRRHSKQIGSTISEMNSETFIVSTNDIVAFAPLTEFPKDTHILPTVVQFDFMTVPVKDERIPVMRLIDKEMVHTLLVNPQKGGLFRKPRMEVWHDQYNGTGRNCQRIASVILVQDEMVHITDKLSRTEPSDQPVFSFTFNSANELVFYWNHAQVPSVSTNIVSGFRRFIFNSTPAQSGYFCLDEILPQ